MTYEQLYREHRSKLIGLLISKMPIRADYKELAEDVVQDAFVAVHDKPIGRLPSAWIGGVAINRMKDIMKVDRRRSERHLAVMEDDIIPPPADYDKVEADRVRLELVRKLITDMFIQLTTREREIMGLRYIHDKQQRDIAYSLGISVDTVNVLLCRAKTKLRKLFLHQYKQLCTT